MIGGDLGPWQGGLQWLPLVLAGAVYAFGVYRAETWPLRRTVAFAGALGVLAVALDSGIDAAADQRLSAHMVQHLLIAMVAAPLAVWSAPIRLLLAAQGRAGRRATGRVLHHLRPLTHPVAGLGVFLVVAAATHVPRFYDAALRDPALHAIEHGALFWSAVALWTPLIAVDPVGQRLGVVGRFSVLMAAMAAMAVGGALLAGADVPLYSFYRAPAASLGVNPLADQAVAGGVMWVGSMIVGLPLLLAVAVRALDREERSQRVRDRRAVAERGTP